ncbi:hypothetical protein GCM10008932_00950 [Alkalibacterium iburiense]|uniref:DUF6429 domain-containing protein n=1 Tax=Alkalibacterium iburiense TaxID=290589 RepID=A0ABN0X018_9LACT
MENLKRELTLLLLYLNSWEDKVEPYSSLRSWKGYDFDDLNKLQEKELIFGSYKTKSITLSEEGISEAKKLLEKYSKQ